MSNGNNDSYRSNHGIFHQLLGTQHNRHYNYHLMSEAKLKWHKHYLEHEQELHRQQQHATRWFRRVRNTVVAIVFFAGCFLLLLTLLIEGGHR